MTEALQRTFTVGIDLEVVSSMERLSAGGSGVRALLAPLGMLLLRPQFLLLPVVGSVVVAALMQLSAHVAIDRLATSWPLDRSQVVAWCQIISIGVSALFLIPLYFLSAMAATQVWRHYTQGRTIRLVLHETHRRVQESWWALMLALVESVLFIGSATLVLASLVEPEGLPLPYPLYAATCVSVAAVLILTAFRAALQPFVAFHANLSREQAIPLAELMVRRELLSIIIVFGVLGGALVALVSSAPLTLTTMVTLLPSLLWYGMAVVSTLTITTWQELSTEHVKALQRGTAAIDVRPVKLPPVLPFRRATNPLSQSELADILQFVRNEDSPDEVEARAATQR